MSNTTEKKPWQFNAKRKIFFIISLCGIIVTLLATFIMNIDIAIEFKGGTIITYRYTGDINADEFDKTIEDIVNSPVNVSVGNNISTGEQNITVSFTSAEGLTADVQAQITDSLQDKFPDSEVSLVDSNDVSPRSGKEFFLKCLVAVVISAVVLIIYIAFRFRKIGGLSAGVCAIIALIHDIVLTYGAFILCGFEINSNFMAVILTILGYSINDTIVVYDRIRENEGLMRGSKLRDIVDFSETQSFRRSVRTSITTITTLLIVTIVIALKGYTSLLSFTVPLIFGFSFGTYSSLCIAPTIWVWWNERKSAKTSE